MKWRPKMYIWYVSYGSNLCEERFHCYIKGGKPHGAVKHEKGCRDKTLPKKNERVTLPYQLYFAKNSSKWGKGGVAFIGHQKEKSAKTMGRMYYITDEQFIDVTAQENNSESVTIDFDKLFQNGYQTINAGWYGRLVYLGKKDGVPMLTFTSNQDIGSEVFKVPSLAYITTIANGLMELGLNKNEVIDYFLQCYGIKEAFTKTTLFAYLFPEK